MARKKKEESMVEPDAVVTELAPTTEEKSETSERKVKRARTTKKPTKKVEKQTQEPKESVQTQEPVQPEQPEQIEQPEVKTVELKTEEKTVEKAEEKAETKTETKPQKNKRSKKATAKNKETGSKETVEKQEPKTEKKDVASVAVESKEEVKKTVTRAEKNETIKSLVKEMLGKRPYKWGELLDESAKLYSERIEEKDGHIANDVRGRIGSVFDIMKKDGEVVFEGGMYALKKAEDQQMPEKTTDKTPEKTTEKSPLPEEKKQPQTKTQEKQPLEREELAPAPTVVAEIKEEKQEKQLPVVKQKAELAPVFDMTSLLSDKGKTEKTGETVKEQKPTATEEKTVETKNPVKVEPKKTEVRGKEVKQPEQKKVENKKVEPAKETKQQKRTTERRSVRTTEGKLKETFLKKIRALGGKYFEYFSIYLLERYSLRNGRRVDGFRVSGGENDGGIDGELEVTDRIGFKETIYVQAKNWKPIYGKEDSWVIGETNLREFIGAVAYRQAKEGKQRCRGIFITTSYFTAGAKEILEKMSDQFVGYDGDDLFETAKECSFGLMQENGEWKLDERLFVGEKAFFNLYE